MTQNFILAIDASWLGPTGIGRVAREVISRCPSNWDVVEINKSSRPAHVLSPITLQLQLLKTHYDVFWSPGFMPTIFPSKRSVITVHDLTHLHWYSWLHKAYYNYLLKPLFRNITTIVTVSNYSRSEFLGWSGVGSRSVKLIKNGVSKVFSSAGPRYDIGHPYLLYVGNRRSYKNVGGLMRIFAESSLYRDGFVLALTGLPDAQTTLLEKTLGLQGWVRYLGFVDDFDLPALYRGAHAFVFLSLYEGFGLPILESMACGTPVLTSNLTSLPEVAGRAALIADPYKLVESAGLLRKICLDDELRASLIQKGALHVLDFSWDIAADSYWDLFNRLAVSK